MQNRTIFLSLLLFVVIDLVFLYANNGIFAKQVIEVQRVAMIIKPLGLVMTYVVLCFAFWFLILREKRKVWEAALLGFIIYSVYEWTNYAILKKWKLSTVAFDSLWGSLLWGITAYLTYEFLIPMEK